jgi:hypothetical protein
VLLKVRQDAKAFEMNFNVTEDRISIVYFKGG